MVLSGRPEQVSLARAFVRQALGDHGPGTDVVVLLTSELVTNSVRHSNSRKPGGTIAVTIAVSGNRIQVEVEDDGGSTVPTLRPGDGLDENGRGLRLVDAYSLCWDYRQTATGTITRFECLVRPML
jgi:anti-sigma regulatory factor (Ser/Thr protein kinase)